MLVVRPGRGGSLVCAICALRNEQRHHFATAQQSVKVPCSTSGMAPQLVQSWEFLRWGLMYQSPPSRDVPPPLYPISSPSGQPHAHGRAAGQSKPWSCIHAPLGSLRTDTKRRAVISTTPKGCYRQGTWPAIPNPCWCPGVPVRKAVLAGSISCFELGFNRSDCWGLLFISTGENALSSS